MFLMKGFRLLVDGYSFTGLGIVGNFLQAGSTGKPATSFIYLPPGKWWL